MMIVVAAFSRFPSLRSHVRVRVRARLLVGAVLLGVAGISVGVFD